MLVDAPAIGGDQPVELRPEGIDQLGHFLGVLCFGQRGEADDVGEEDGGLLALLLGCGRGVERGQLGAHGHQGGIDDGIAQHQPLAFDGRHGGPELGAVADRRHGRIVPKWGGLAE